MKNIRPFYASIFLAIVTIVCLIITGYFYKQHQIDHNRLNQIGRILEIQRAIEMPSVVGKPDSIRIIDSLMRRIEVQAIEEDHYLNQLGMLSDWFILYVTGLFGVIALFGFFNFKRIEDIVNNQTTKNEEQFDRFEDKFKDIEAENHKMLGNIHAGLGDVYLDSARFSNACYHYTFAILEYSRDILNKGYC